MSNFNVKINLSQIRGAKVMPIQGKREVRNCIVIPIENHLGTVTDGYTAKDGTWQASDVQLNLTAIAMREPRWGKSHFLKPSVTKEVFEQLTEEDIRRMPIVGNLYPWASPNQAPAPTVDDLPEDTEEDW